MCYYGLPFEVYRGFTQGEPLSPTIFNLVNDAIIRHWVTVAMEAGVEGLGMSIQDLVPYLYADDGVIMSTKIYSLQRAFDVLAELFDWVGLRKNTWKMLSMVCQTFHMPRRMSMVL